MAARPLDGDSSAARTADQIAAAQAAGKFPDQRKASARYSLFVNLMRFVLPAIAFTLVVLVIAALERRFQPVLVGEPSVPDTIAILRGLKERSLGAVAASYIPSQTHLHFSSQRCR